MLKIIFQSKMASDSNVPTMDKILFKQFCLSLSAKELMLLNCGVGEDS